MEELLTPKEYVQKVEAVQGGVVVYFCGQGCPACPGVEKRMKDLEPKTKQAKFYKLQRERIPEVIDLLQLQAVPTVIAYENGHPVAMWVGSSAGVEFGKFAENWAPASKPPKGYGK